MEKAGSPAPILIEVREVGKSVGSRQGADSFALSGVSFQVHAGEIFAITGPSGSGKTTLLRLLNRLEDPDAGRILIGGEDLMAIDPIALRKRVGMLFQVPAFPEGTVADAICFGPVLRGVPRESVLPHARELLRTVGLSEAMLERDPSTLSQGEQQRLAMVSVLLNEPEVILVDEPASALDACAADRILELIRTLNEKLHLTVIMITHLEEHARRIAHRGLALEAGRLRRRLDYRQQGESSHVENG